MRRLLICLPIFLVACEGNEMRDTLGLNRSAPDEFRVVSRPKLTVPPDFTLTVPTPGQGRPDQQADRKAEALLLKSGGAPRTLDEVTPSGVDTAVPVVLQAPLSSTGESSFLKRAGADVDNSAIREQLREDAITPPPTPQSESASPLDRWLGLDGEEPVVDAPAEAERLRTNREENKPVSSGETPSIDPRQRSVVDKLFNE